MRLPAGHARRLFLGFTCSTMFLVVFALLIAQNSGAENPGIQRASLEDSPLTVGIATPNPEGTIEFYRKLGFRSVDGLSGSLDSVSMEKKDSPYKLEICHNKFSDSGVPRRAVSGMSFRVKNLARSVEDLQTKGLRFVETNGHRDGVQFASLTDPNGISIKLFEP